ncbi:MAG: protease modulator HflC [Clostridia bacterium]|nr:protease modulator HflC [Clostridia bacterium]
MKKGRFALIIAAVAVILILASIAGGVFYTVKPNQYAVVRQFGKIVDIKDEPGLKIKLPLIQNVSYISKEIIFYDIPESDVITKDKKSMVVDSFVLWRITDPGAVIRTLNATRGRAEERIEAAVYNAIKNIISSMNQAEVIEARGETLTQKITGEAGSDIAQYGIEIITAQIKTFSLPADNQNAVYERMISERQNIAAGYIANGNADAQKIKNETDKQVELQLAEAEKDAAILVAEGEQEYMRILQDAYNSEEKAAFYEYIRGLDALKESLSGSGKRTIILDKDDELVKILTGSSLSE